MHRGYISLARYMFASMVLLSTISLSGGFSAGQALMLNPDVLQMLMNGGFDIRQPARIFLPPKYYSSGLYDTGHRSPEEIFRTNIELMMEAVYDDSLLNQSPSTASLSQAALATATTSGGAFNRPNSISYSDGGTGNRNKGSGALKKNTVTNFKSSLSLAPSASASRKTIASSIVRDQTRSGVSQIVSPLGGSTGGNSRQSFDRSRDATVDYNLRSALPGEPDVDYPILGRIPETSFKCHQRRDGYYADVEARCQVFRVCANTDDSGSGFAFLCPNGTLFNQKYFVCDWYMNVRCEESENFYSKNEELGKNTADFGKMMGAVMSMVSFPMMSSMMSDGAIRDVKPSSLNNEILANRKHGHDFSTGDFVDQNLPVYRINSNMVQPGGAKSDVFQSKFNKESSFQHHTGKDVPHPSKQVYVSSLGTLSTDPQSGFDPRKSSFLVPPGGAQLLPPRLTSGWKASSVNQQHYNEEAISAPPMPKVEFELLMGKLLKSWTDMGFAKAPAPRLQPKQVFLPPSGVLPPSPVPFGSIRRWAVTGKSQIAQAPPAPRNPNPATVQNVIRVNKVSVAPQSYRQPSYVSVPQTGYFIPQSVAPRFIVASRPPVNPSPAQISRRNDVLVQRILPPTPAAVGREVGYDIEIVPSKGYYLNNEQERKSYFHALQKRLPGLENGSYYNSGVSSYNVPISSIGPFYNARY
ncbi:uncharacterized protein LOC135700958 [Ochlerotatus camptorhynchus]|uniref:uncharacterized protein LOC135700958 n=1 Tax=Ochlerotatus camptorhynchus TaxID=644619 RepID=UPI0031DCFAEC